MRRGAHHRRVTERGAGAVRGEAPDPDHAPRPERADDAGERLVACLVERLAFGGRQLVGSTVAPRFLHEAERAVVPDEETLEEARGLAETAPRPSPEPAPAHLAAGAVEAGDGPLRMLDLRPRDLSPYPEPVAGKLHVAEGYAGLRHPERTGVHPEHQGRGRARAVAGEVRAVGRPCVVERVVDVGHRGSERERAGPPRERPRDGHDLRGPGHPVRLRGSRGGGRCSRRCARARSGCLDRERCSWDRMAGALVSRRSAHRRRGGYKTARRRAKRGATPGPA